MDGTDYRLARGRAGYCEYLNTVNMVNGERFLLHQSGKIAILTPTRHGPRARAGSLQILTDVFQYLGVVRLGWFWYQNDQ